MSEDLRSLLEETIFDYFEGSMPAHLASGVADLVLAMPAIEELRAENELLKAELDELKAEHDVAFDRALAKTREAHDLLVENERLKKRVETLDRIYHEQQSLTLACGGLSPEAGEWAIRIAAKLMAEWEEGSTHADTYYIVEAWWRSCPPEVRAQILKQGEQ